MTATASASWPADTDPALAAAVKYAVGLVSVLKGFTRHVMRLGRVTQDVVAGLKSKGVDVSTPQACGHGISDVISALRRALMMADALRVRLLTPAVALAMTRPPRTASGSGGGARGERRPRQKDRDDPVELILCRRTHPHTREAYANMIATMSDRQVVQRIYTDLFSAAEALRVTVDSGGIVMLAYNAIMLIFPDLKELARGRRASGNAARPKQGDAATGEAHASASAVQPVPREVGRGPP